MSVARKSVVGALALVAAGLALAVAWSLSASVRTSVKWAVSSGHYKREVLALPPPADGYLKHIQWDAWGFLSSTVVYLVYDPTNALAPAAAAKKSGRFTGLPCDVYRVHQLDRSWYTVHFYADTSWQDCSGSAITAPKG